MKTTKTSAPKTARKAAPKTAKPEKKRGNITAAEIQPLIMAAREAWLIQEPGIAFDAWRSEQVMEAVQLPGLTSCNSSHFCDLMGHFKAAAGKEEEAMHWFLRAGKNAERQVAWSIVSRLEAHTSLATATEDEIRAKTLPRSLDRLLDRRCAILDHVSGPISIAYLVSIVRDKTGRPNLTLGDDLVASLAERCTFSQLLAVRNTLVNRIAEREGTGHTSDRNKSQKSAAAKARRSPHEMAPRAGFDGPF